MPKHYAKKSMGKGSYKPKKKAMKGSHKIKGTKAAAKKMYKSTASYPWGGM